ncbi:MAG: hypothetical protein ACI9GM_000467 [Salibacteraceae bacterium]|jgi:hypothetical protein
MNTSNQPSVSLLSVLILLFTLGFTGPVSVAQNSKSTPITKTVPAPSDSQTQQTKTIEIEKINGEKVVTVRTVHKGEKTIMIYTGEEAEKFLQQQTITNRLIQEEDLQNMQFPINLEGMEKGDSKKILIMSNVVNSPTDEADTETIIWTTSSEEEHAIEMERLTINVTKSKNSDPIKIHLNNTDEEGKK